MNSPVLAASHLEKTYYGKVDAHVLKGVDLEVHAGEFMAVMGQSGSGKTTLLNLFGCLDRPTGGRLRIGGQDPAQLDDDELALLRADMVGFVFQSHFLLDEYTCLENALLPLLIRKGHVTRSDQERVVQLLSRVRLNDQLDKHPDEMSGGQNQRTAIVRALANQPRVILADEPTGNLDSENGVEVFSLFRELGKEAGIAVVMVTHDDRLAKQADRIVTMRDGKLETTNI
jgi:ABC-type lipoprotein export system ATPase subunit